jgi:hypothetical protein
VAIGGDEVMCLNCDRKMGRTKNAQKSTHLVGDFNSWDLKKHTMKKDNKGRWTKIVTLAPGRYEYKFLVDGQWQNDPNNDQIVANSFGTLNNILTV